MLGLVTLLLSSRGLVWVGAPDGNAWQRRPLRLGFKDTCIFRGRAQAALEGVRDELPHSIAVVVEEMGLRADRPEDKPLLDV